MKLKKEKKQIRADKDFNDSGIKYQVRKKTLNIISYG